MFKFILALCLTSQVFGATLFSNDAHGKQDQSGVFGKAHAKTHGKGDISASSKDYEYAYEKAGKSAHNDGEKKNKHPEGYGTDGVVSKVTYNNDYEQNYERGVGSGHKDEFEHEYKFNNDIDLKDSSIKFGEKYTSDVDSAAFPHGLFKRSPSAYHKFNKHLNHFDENYPFFFTTNTDNGHALNKRSPSTHFGGFPAYNHHGFNAYNNGYNGYNGFPAFHHGGFHGIHKRSVAGFNGYNNFNNGFNYGYPAAHGNPFGFRFFH